MNPSAQSKTISPEQLKELELILASYEQITEQLWTRYNSSEKRIDALETGFSNYGTTVDNELIPKALALERKVKILEIFLVISMTGTTVLAVIVAVK